METNYFILKSAIMGIIEGLTEFLPISSTGHLIIANTFFKFEEPFASMFEVVIQLGAILSVIVYFHKRLNPLVTDTQKRKYAFSIWIKALVAVMPAILIGGIFGKKIKECLFNPIVVSISLVVGGVILIVIERIKKRNTFDDISQLSYGIVLGIGAIQCFAMIPGTSRSAATIIGAMLFGASRPLAAEFSFYLAIPTMFAASAYSILKHYSNMTILEWQALACGFIVSFIVALIAIAFLMNYISKKDFSAFGWYRIILGSIVFIFFL